MQVLGQLSSPPSSQFAVSEEPRNLSCGSSLATFYPSEWTIRHRPAPAGTNQSPVSAPPDAPLQAHIPSTTYVRTGAHIAASELHTQHTSTLLPPPSTRRWHHSSYSASLTLIHLLFFWDSPNWFRICLSICSNCGAAHWVFNVYPSYWFWFSLLALSSLSLSKPTEQFSSIQY